jgi:hypothetical protein
VSSCSVDPLRPGRTVVSLIGHPRDALHNGSEAVTVSVVIEASPGPRTGGTPSAARYDTLADRRLAAVLAAEDAAEDDGLNPLERLTCHVHRRWVHQCVSSDLHANPVTRHRWCRDCETAANVAVDELTGAVRITCPRCGRTPECPATRQIIRTCKASLAAQRCTATAARPVPGR